MIKLNKFHLNYRPEVGVKTLSMLGLRRGVPLYRTYATSPDFLSDLLKRVDQVTSRASALKPYKDLPLKKGTNKAAGGDAKKNGPKRRTDHHAQKQASGSARGSGEAAKTPHTPKQRTSDTDYLSFSSASSTSTIKVKSHPLMNTFGAAYAGTSFSLASDSSRGGPRRNPRPQRTDPANASSSNSQSPQSRLATSALRPQRKPRSVPVRGRPSGKKEVVYATTSPVLVPVQPSLSADNLFYGKVATVNTSVSSRVASLAKQTLVESKYPYLLPQHVIDSLPTKPQNRFIAHRNHSLGVDQDTFFNRFKSLVLGKYSPLQIPPKLVSATEAAQVLSRNGSIPHELKQTIVEAVAGKLLAKDLLKDAVWLKK